MKLRHPVFIRFAAFLLATLPRAWLATIRLRVVNCDTDHHPLDPRRRRVLYAFWHEDILLSMTRRAKIRVLISQHADGELIARTAAHLGKGAVRGSTTRGGSAAV